MPEFPPPPVTTIDWSNVGFRIREVNGHVESHYSVHTGKWSPLKWVEDPYMKLHGMSPALNYGQQAYEGLKAFRAPGDKAIQAFRPDRNAARMQHSAEFVSIPPVPIDLFLDAVRAAIARNAEYVPPHETGAALYVRPHIYGSSAQLGLNPPEEYTFCVFVVPTGVYHGTAPTKAWILDDFDRAAPNGTGSAKVGGNYAPVLRWTEKAKSEGYGINLHLDSATRTEIDEFSTSGFIGVTDDGQGNITLVVPDSKNVIDSVTSDSVQEIAKSFGWKVEKRPIKYSDLPSFSEVMAAGTAASLVPIRSITRRMSSSNPQSLAATVKEHPRLEVTADQEIVTYIPSSQEDAGPVCKKLLSHLQGIQLGRIKDDFGWNLVIEEADKQKAT